MIKIENLTPRQCEILDVLWNCDSLGKLMEWQAMLPHHEYLLSLSLQRLIVLELIDQAIEESTNYELAQSVISDIKSK